MSREITCCFTGHRPDKLPWGVQEEDLRCHLLKVSLSAARHSNERRMRERKGLKKA